MKRATVRLLRAVFGGLGWLAGWFAPPVRARVLCVFATPDIGGAERYHADMVQAVADVGPQVWFTETPRNAGLLPLYPPGARMLGRWTARRVCSYFAAGYFGCRVRRGGVGTVLGAFSHLFYDMLPWMHGVRCVDLIHNFGVNFEHYSLPHVPRLATRVVVHPDLAEQLHAMAQGPRPRVIGAGVECPPHAPPKGEGELRVLYVGRATPEKRVHLVGELARELARRGVRSEMTLVGDVEAAIAPQDCPLCRFAGVVTDAQELRGHYARAHVLLLTSEREGLPLALLEAMAMGAVPVCTAVGAIPQVLADAGAGQAVPPDQPVGALADVIEGLASGRDELAAQGRRAHAYVLAHHSMDTFRAAWRELLLGGADG